MGLNNKQYFLVFLFKMRVKRNNNETNSKSKVNKQANNYTEDTNETCLVMINSCFNGKRS